MVELAKLRAAFQLKGFPIAIAFLFEFWNFDGPRPRRHPHDQVGGTEIEAHKLKLRIRLVMPTKDRQTGKSITVEDDVIIDAKTLLVPLERTAVIVAEAIRPCLHGLILHEIDECIEANGQRIFDPHRAGETSPPA